MHGFAAPPSKAARRSRCDFQAVSADGQPVADLKPDEVSLRVAGRARPVKSLQLIRVAGGAAAAVPSPFGTNAGAGDGRQVAIIVEDASLRAGGEVPLRAAIGAFLDGLGPADRVAFSLAPHDTATVGFGGRRRQGPGRAGKDAGPCGSGAHGRRGSVPDA